jgi:glycolate oxidase FAD binding subunit
VVLDLSGLDRVIEYEPDDLVVTVEAGVTLGALAARLGDHRQFVALDPPRGDTRTLGGIAATNAIGPLACRYGAMRDRLLGVRFVQADGVLTWGGAKVVKSVTGYDVPKLMIGALGTLGVLAELTLRLHPCPEHEATVLVSFDALDAAEAFVVAMLDSTIQPSRLEILNRAALEARGIAAAAAVAVSISSVEAAVVAQADEVRVRARDVHARVQETPAGWWDGYGDAMARSSVALRIGTLTSEMARTIRTVERLFGTETAVSGTAATGTLHAFLDVPRSPRAIDELSEAITGLRAEVTPLGGHATITRAPRALRETLDPWGPVDPGALSLMRALKDEFDPHRVLNPGRFVGGL